MEQQRIIHLLLSRAMDFITRLALHWPAALAFERPSAPHKRLLFVSSCSLCLALALAWVAAGLPRPDGLRVAFASGTTRYVAITGTDTVNACSVSASPCRTLQHAADQSAAGDELRIAGGTYTSVTLRLGSSQIAYITTTVTIRGGYTTTDGFAVSAPVANPTILDAGGGGRVLFISGADASISNLTVQNGSNLAVSRPAAGSTL
jgi:hypothetical protein